MTRRDVRLIAPTLKVSSSASMSQLVMSTHAIGALSVSLLPP